MNIIKVPKCCGKPTTFVALAICQIYVQCKKCGLIFEIDRDTEEQEENE